LVKKIICLSFLACATTFVNAQQGCTDPLASNYSSGATVNDGSCVYESTNYTMEDVADLNSSFLNENSGIIVFNDHVFTINDGGNSNTIYELDTMGSIIREINILSATNVDWEAISQNSQSVFVGDFGNNSGSRENLCIYEISKADIQDPSVNQVTAIRSVFRYEDQVDFTWGSNAHNYDCEAFLCTEDSMYLFSKNWIDEETKRYSLPISWVDTATAILNNSFNVDGLVTDASIDSSGESVMLLGYKNNGANFYTSFIWMLWDYNANDFFSGNKRRIEIGTMLSLGQTEGIALKGNASGFVSSEEISSVITIPPKLLKFDFSEYFNGEALNIISKGNKEILIYPNPSTQFIRIEKQNEPFKIYELATSKLVLKGLIKSNQIDVSSLRPGHFYLQVGQSRTKFTKQK